MYLLIWRLVTYVSEGVNLQYDYYFSLGKWANRNAMLIFFGGAGWGQLDIVFQVVHYCNTANYELWRMYLKSFFFLHILIAEMILIYLRFYQFCKDLKNRYLFCLGG